MAPNRIDESFVNNFLSLPATVVDVIVSVFHKKILRSLFLQLLTFRSKPVNFDLTDFPNSFGSFGRIHMCEFSVDYFTADVSRYSLRYRSNLMRFFVFDFQFLMAFRNAEVILIISQKKMGLSSKQFQIFKLS